MYILGISGLYHDSAACLIRDGVICCAFQEERFSRIKHDASLPKRAIDACLQYERIDESQIDYVVYYENPWLVVDRSIGNILCSNGGKDVLVASFDRIINNLSVKDELRRILGRVGRDDELYLCSHHISHAASAYFPSPYEEAVIITVDGVGEWATTTIGVGKGNKIRILEEIQYPHSLGLLYSAFTYYCGFRVNYGEYKLMGLSPYGSKKYSQLIKDNIITLREDGSFSLNMEFFGYHRGETMINEDAFFALFGEKRRQPESDLSEFYMDVAASIQSVVEEALIGIVRRAKLQCEPAIDNLVLSGGVALNCVANGKIHDTKMFKNVWVQPASGDAGGALGSALYMYYQVKNGERIIHGQSIQGSSALGNSYTNRDVRNFLKENKYTAHEYKEFEELYEKIAELIDQQCVIGLFQGRMEYGPRALGFRSIIADARSREMQSKLNLAIKKRESFRPFAPAVLANRANDYFDISFDSPYMLFVENVREERRYAFDIKEYVHDNDVDLSSIVKFARSDIPAVTHVDYSSRIQTVDESNRYLYGILKAFEKRTGCPVIINTSFNVRGEPIVESIQDAYTCFMETAMDVLVIENWVFYKKEQPVNKENKEWRKKYELD